MEHAATQTSNETGLSATLRLRQGSSSRASWTLDEAPGGTMIAVGSDAACDWQIRAAFVPARAFSVLLVQGQVFLRSGPEPGVLLNGKPLAGGWVLVPEGARIDVGLARLEVTTEYTVSYDVVDEAPARARVTRPYAVGMVDEPTPTFAERRQERRQEPLPSAMREPPLPFEAEAPVLLESRPKPASRRPRDLTSELEEMPFAESGEYEVVPALLDDDAPKDKRSFKRYALLGVITAGAYGGWVALLDHL